MFDIHSLRYHESKANLSEYDLWIRSILEISFENEIDTYFNLTADEFVV